MAGRDLLGVAQTGTGKTAAFALPILDQLARERRPAGRRACRVLVLSPTRELASQIADSFRTYGRHMGFSVAVIFGGVKYGAQIKAMARGVDILVATPGRLIDHMGQRTVNLGSTEILVLDEADQMLDLGFLQPIRRIVATLSKNRQSLFFSATMPTEIGRLAGEMLRDPQRVAVTPVATTVEKVRQRMIFIESDRKRELLAELFEDERMDRTIVFTKTKRGADRVAKSLEAAGVTATSIHGDKSQGQRERALAAFKAGETRALVATDIAARGIDIDAVSHVVNYELPYVPEAYVHRIGRTARAGASGQAISLCADDERGLAKDIEKLIRQNIETTDRRRDAGLALMAKSRPPEVSQPRGQPRPAVQRTGQKAHVRAPAAQPLTHRGPRRRRGGGGGGKPSFGGGRAGAPQARV
jgi:ATP-dependent RNA helicase RhlE